MKFLKKNLTKRAMDSTGKGIKPSCPKDFFAKLYGHLEENNSKVQEKDKETGEFVESKNSLLRCLNIKTDKIFNGINEFGFCKIFEKSYAEQKKDRDNISAPFSLFPTVLPRNAHNFCMESTFTAGFTAYRKSHFLYLV